MRKLLIVAVCFALGVSSGYAQTDSLPKVSPEYKAELTKLIDNMAIEQALDMTDIAAALAYIGQEEQPLFPKMEPLDVNAGRSERRERNNDRGDRSESSRGRERSERRDGSFADREAPEEGMERYYLGVGRMDNVSPRDIVGAIANEANLESKYIGHIKLFEKFSTVDLPEAMPEELGFLSSNSFCSCKKHG